MAWLGDPKLEKSLPSTCLLFPVESYPPLLCRDRRQYPSHRPSKWRCPMASRPTTLLPDSKLNTGAGGNSAGCQDALDFDQEPLSVLSRRIILPPNSKVKAAPPRPLPNLNYGRKPKPERRRATSVRGKIDGASRDQLENSKSFEQHQSPVTARQLNSLTRSLDYSGKRNIGGALRLVIRALQQFMIDEGRWVSYDSRALRQSMIDEKGGGSHSMVNYPLIRAMLIRRSQVGLDTDLVNLTASKKSKRPEILGLNPSQIPAGRWDLIF